MGENGIAKVTGLAFWKRVERTDPRHTKHVDQRGGFTAIDAYYQLQTATNEWGPAGGAWHWDVDLQLIGAGSPEAVWLARVSLYHPMGEHPVIQYGCKDYYQPAARLREGEQSRPPKADDDAPKKAVTDGLTKCLSYLGFSADVFLGKFDDSKYVEKVRAEIAKEEGVPVAAPKAVAPKADDGSAWCDPPVEPSGNVIIGKVEAVAEKVLASGSTRYGIKVNGEWLNSFDAEVGSLAKSAKGSSTILKFTYDTNVKDGRTYKDIVEVTVAEA